MEEAYKIHSYLPLRYKNIGEEEYVKYLWRAFVNNYENEQYQFAFMSFHMLFMCFVYFSIWKIKSIHPEDFNKICLGFDDCIEQSSSPFGYSKEHESKILLIFKFWGIGKEKIGEYKTLIRKRNDVAHSNGNIFFQDQQSIDDIIFKVIRFCDEIQKKTKPSIEGAYAKFLSDNYSVKDSSYSSIEELIDGEFIHNHYISEEDINLCINSSITELSSHSKFEEIKDIYTQIVKLYKID